MTNAIEFLDSLDIEHKSATSTEEVIRLCQNCGNDNWKLYVNKEKGLYHCKVCGIKGNLFKLKTLYGVVENVASVKDLVSSEYKPMDFSLVDVLEKVLWSDKDALDYLHERGFTDDTIRHFHLGCSIEGNEKWIAIPHIHEGILWNIKYRRFMGGDKLFKRVKGQPTILFNLDGIDFTKGGVLITEAELDAVAAWQMNVPNVVGLTAGADTFLAEWIKAFSTFKSVFLCLDSDEPGQKGARKIADKLGLARTKNVVLPTKDVNEFMQKIPNCHDEFKLLIGSATKFELESVSNASELVKQLDDWFDGEDSGLSGIPTGFTQLDYLTRGLKSEELLIISGDSGIGKTTFTLNLINECVQPTNNEPIFGFFLEGQIPYYFNRMLGLEAEIPILKLRDDPERWETLKEFASNYPFYYYSGPQGDLTIEQLKSLVKAVVNLYDVRVVFLDNLQKLVGESDPAVHLKVGDAASTLKDLAVDLKITVVAISHIRKKDQDNPIITKHDAKSSSTIYQVSDSFWILQLINNQYYLTIEKNRTGPDHINVKMDFIKETGRFKETGDMITEGRVSSVPRVKE